MKIKNTSNYRVQFVTIEKAMVVILVAVLFEKKGNDFVEISRRIAKIIPKKIQALPGKSSTTKSPWLLQNVSDSDLQSELPVRSPFYSYNTFLTNGTIACYGARAPNF